MDSTSVDRVSIHGVTLAALMYSCMEWACTRDGLLYGHLSRTTTSRLQDHEKTEEEHDTVVHLTSFRCHVQTGSFYDGAGQVDLPALDPPDGEPQRPLIGWFVYRPHTGPQPSMREAAVTFNLLHHIQKTQSGCPAVLGIITRSTEHNGATTNLNCQFSILGQGGVLKPVKLSIVNLGRSLGQDMYKGFLTSAYNSLAHDLGDTSSPGAVSGAAKQTQEVEAMYEKLFQQLQKTAQEVSASHQRVIQLQQSNEALFKRLMERMS